MNGSQIKNGRVISILAFSFLSAYILSFSFEGQVLYGLLALHQIEASGFILIAMVGEFLGLLTCGFFVHSLAAAKSSGLWALGICFTTLFPFFFAPNMFWSVCLVIGGFAGGWAIAAWGYFLKEYTPSDQRLKTCAYLLILSNLVMIVINTVAANVSAYLGLILVLTSLVLGFWFLRMLATDSQTASPGETEKAPRAHISRSLLLLCLFISVITINSGLMYQVINPAFEHLTALTSWYWAVPYILALIVVSNLLQRENRSMILYVGLGMIIAAFISFMLLGRGAFDYLVVNTLMLGACGILDLFWWSILGRLLDFTSNPARVFGIGLSANVLGILIGDTLGMSFTFWQLPGAEVSVIALTVVCVTLIILPPLNRQLLLLLKSHAFLSSYGALSQAEQAAVLHRVDPLDPLTVREQDVLELILSGKSNREIGDVLFISESTVKTHTRNIFSKYAVRSRAELISIFLRGN